MEKEYITIGELAKQMGVSVRTLQYYDQEGLLKPSGFSEGGRRLYSPKDIVQLHQILSFKYLGFSLEEIKNNLLPVDTPEDVLYLLENQEKALEEEIASLQEARDAIQVLRKEVANFNRVNFKKYAEIVELIRMGNKEYWIWTVMDDGLTDHIQKRFMNDQEAGERIIEKFQEVQKKALKLKKRNEPIDSEESIKLAADWWQVIMDFTEGDLSLIPNLMAFNEQKDKWDEDMAKKQAEIDEYIGQILGVYFQKEGIQFPMGE